MIPVSPGPKRDSIATESRGATWNEHLTHNPLVVQLVHQSGCIEHVWAISSKEDGSATYGAMTTYVDGQEGFEDR